MHRWDYVWFIGASLVAIGTVFASFLTSDTALKLGFVGAGTGLFGAEVGLLAIVLAHRTDSMMRATASHDFYEKQAALNVRAETFEHGQELSVFEWQGLIADVAAVRQLKRWAPDDQRNEMKGTLDFITTRARNSGSAIDDQEYISRLETLANEIQEGK